MKTRLIIASVILLIAAFVHTIGGELTDIRALLLSEIPLNLKLEIRGTWYLVAIDFLISAAYLFYLIFKNKLLEQILLISFIGIRMLLYGLLFLILILLTENGLLFQVPQWILLMSVGILLEWDFLLKKTKSN